MKAYLARGILEDERQSLWNMLEEKVLEARYGVLIVRGSSRTFRWYTDDEETPGPLPGPVFGALRAKWGDPYAIRLAKGRDYVLVGRTAERSESSIGGPGFYTVTLRFKILPHPKPSAPAVRGKPVERDITFEEDLNRTDR
ncbi:MAG: hypothetical protein HY303_17945 [Candidatus Wallbacteria bacterium]|nr:hypothetical protein [Candidatus Wallbacteria bacterium]